MKCRVHLGDSTSSRLQGSIPTVFENTLEGQGRQPNPCPSCRIWCHCYADDFVTGLSRALWELFHQHISCLFSGSSSSSLLKSSSEETYLSTASPGQNKMPASLSHQLLCLEGTGEPSEGPGRIQRKVHTTNHGLGIDLCIVFSHLLICHFVSQIRQMCAQKCNMWL